MWADDHGLLEEEPLAGLSSSSLAGIAEDMGNRGLVCRLCPMGGIPVPASQLGDASVESGSLPPFYTVCLSVFARGSLLQGSSDTC